MTSADNMIQENAVKAYNFLISKGFSKEDAKLGAMQIIKTAVKSVAI